MLSPRRSGLYYGIFHLACGKIRDDTEVRLSRAITRSLVQRILSAGSFERKRVLPIGNVWLNSASHNHEIPLLTQAIPSFPD